MANTMGFEAIDFSIFGVTKSEIDKPIKTSAPTIAWSSESIFFAVANSAFWTLKFSRS